MSITALSPVSRAVRTMTSREIADLTGKDHKNVIRDIRAMLDELSGDGSDLSHVTEETDGRGYTSLFRLDRELTDTLLTGYSAVARRAVIRRWHNLEAEAQQRQHSRLEGKVTRKALQDVIAGFIEYARHQGSSNADWYFTTITTMEYKALGLVKQAGDKSFRDSLDALSNTKLAMVEMVCQHGLAAGMTQGLPYKEIFKLAQGRVAAMVSGFGACLPEPTAPLRIQQATHPPPRKRQPAKVEAPTLGPVEASIENPNRKVKEPT